MNTIKSLCCLRAFPKVTYGLFTRVTIDWKEENKQTFQVLLDTCSELTLIIRDQMSLQPTGQHNLQGLLEVR